MKDFTYQLFLFIFLISCQQSSELVNKPCKVPIGNSKKTVLTSSFYDDVPVEFSGLKDSIFKYEEQYDIDPQIAFDSIAELTLQKVITLPNITRNHKVDLLKSKAFQLYSTVSSYQLQFDKTVARLNQAQSLISPLGSIQDSVAMAGIANLLGVAFEALGNYPQALYYHKLSYNLNYQMGRAKGVVIDLGNIGIIFQIGSQPDSSIYYLEKVACILTQNPKEIKLPLTDSLGVYYNLGRAYLEAAEKAKDNSKTVLANWYYEQGINQSREVLERIRQSPEVFGVYPYFLAAQNVANIFLKYNRPDKFTADSTIHYLNIAKIPLESFYKAQKSYPPNLQEVVLIRTAAAMAQRGECISARDSFYKAELMSPSLRYLMELNYLKAQTDGICMDSFGHRNDQLKSQLNHYKKTISNLEEILITPGLENVVAAIKKRYQYNFNEAIAVANELYEMDEGKETFNEVFQLCDRSQSFNLKQRIYQKLDENNLGKVEQILFQREKQLREQLKEQPNNLTFNIAFKNFITELKNSNNTEEYTYYLKRFNKTAYDISDIRQQLLNDTTALIQYHITPTKGYVLVVSQQSEKIFPLEIDSQIIRMGEKFYESLNPKLPKNSLFRESAFPLYQKVFRQVDNWLIEQGKDIQNLIIIRDGFLQKIPFEGLLSKAHHGKDYKDLNYLMNRYTIAYHYSVSSMIGLKKLKVLTLKKANTDFLLLDATISRSIDNQRGNNLPLPAINKAGGELLKMMDKANISTHFAEKAQKIDFYNWVNRVTVLQLNMHAYLDNSNPLKSYFQFYDTETESKYQQLNVKEIYEMDLANLELAVLSNCNSIDGMALAGDELISLVRAFTYSGCTAVIGATHTIEDKSTAAILIEFYENLLSGQTKDKALNNAKKNFLQTNPDAHPQFWLNLVCLGDNSPIEWNQQAKS